MADELRDVMADLELSLVETVAWREQAEMDLLYVGVLDLEQRIEALHDTLAFVADSIAKEPLTPIAPRSTPPPTGSSRRRSQRPEPPGCRVMDLLPVTMPAQS